jgi:hypothetical protein
MVSNCHAHFPAAALRINIQRHVASNPAHWLSREAPDRK